MVSEKYKYAIVRIPENSVIDFFSTIVSKGYSDVSFVSSLSQCSMRDDPNDEPGSSSFKDSLDDDSTSENNKSSPSRQSSASMPVLRPPPVIPSVKNEISDVPPTSSTNSTPVDILTQSMSADLISNLFGKADFELNPSEWAEMNQLASNGNSSGNEGNQFHPYKNTRMKGWQREYIKEVINNGHYPTEDELRDIEQKCDLSRKQVLRFIAKRLVNPNRKPRINHYEEKRQEQEQAQEIHLQLSA
ncbi:unnamed protein product [Caenorhabditis bovis]|uniref:Homeobox domain-containing protein n=1 Tax=Caenorhabditis bovis TaxID=2654633 RepID=A0A8S1F7R6_9PELO|nr:unnamed protein product [Caenorhabditis bovis]